MATEFTLQVFTQEKKALDERVTSIIVPGADGALGIMAHHAALVALLGTGDLWIRRPSGAEQTWAISGGFVEMRDNVATLLVDAFSDLPR
jgi:F-type H+-transporting ATPase subunit epsilon